MQDHLESSITVIKVIDEDDAEVSIPFLDLDDKDRDNLFEDLDPDREEFEGYTGNAGPILECFYHSVVLLILLRSDTFAYACDGRFQEAVRVILRRVNFGATDAEETLLEAVDYGKDFPSETYSHLADLLDIACKIKLKNAAGALIALMDTGLKISRGGCTSQKHVDALVTVVTLYGWEEFGPLVINLVKKTLVAMVAHAAALAVRFSKVDNLPASADCVAEAVMDAWGVTVCRSER